VCRFRRRSRQFGHRKIVQPRGQFVVRRLRVNPQRALHDAVADAPTTPSICTHRAPGAYSRCPRQSSNGRPSSCPWLRTNWLNNSTPPSGNAVHSPASSPSAPLRSKPLWSLKFRNVRPPSSFHVRAASPRTRTRGRFASNSPVAPVRSSSRPSPAVAPPAARASRPALSPSARNGLQRAPGGCTGPRRLPNLHLPPSPQLATADDKRNRSEATTNSASGRATRAETAAGEPGPPQGHFGHLRALRGRRLPRAARRLRPLDRAGRSSRRVAASCPAELWE